MMHLRNLHWWFSRDDPTHPVLSSFSIAFFGVTFVSDLIFWSTGDIVRIATTMWLLGAGLFLAALAAVVGLIDILAQPRMRASRYYTGGNALVVLIEVYNWYSRYRWGKAAIIPTGLILSFLVICILLFTGWKGREKVNRYLTDAADDDEGPR